MTNNFTAIQNGRSGAATQTRDEPSPTQTLRMFSQLARRLLQPESLAFFRGEYVRRSREQVAINTAVCRGRINGRVYPAVR